MRADNNSHLHLHDLSHSHSDTAIKMYFNTSWSFEEDDGASPLVLALRSNAKRMGAGCFPLPGIGAWVQLSLHECPNARAGAATVVAVPVSSLVEAGLTILADLHTFACTASGGKVIRESAVVATLHSERQLLWIPYGFFPFVVAREPETDESSNKLCHASLWVKTVFHPSLCRAVSHPVWTPINNMNIEHLQHLSGQKLWQSRKVTYEKLTAERAALMLQFEDTSTGGGRSLLPKQLAE